MIAFARRDSIKTGAVDLDRVFMVGNRAVFAGAEINDSLLFIDRINRPDIPVTTGNLVDEFAIRAAVINATPAAPRNRSTAGHGRVCHTTRHLVPIGFRRRAAGSP